MGVPRLYTVDLLSAPTERALTDDELERFTVVLFEDHTITGPTPSAALHEGRLDVRTSVEAPDLRTAIDIAVRAFTRAAAAAAVNADLEAISGSVDGGDEHASELVTRRGRARAAPLRVQTAN